METTSTLQLTWAQAAEVSIRALAGENPEAREMAHDRLRGMASTADLAVEALTLLGQIRSSLSERNIEWAIALLDHNKTLLGHVGAL